MRRLVVSLAGTLALLVALELGLRALGYDEIPEPFQFAQEAADGVRPGRFVVDDERFWTTAAHHRASDEHLGRYATGDWPYRGDSPKYGPSIAFFGDSCTYGVGLTTSRTLPAQVAAQPLTTPLASLNFGCPGYSCVQIDAALAAALEAHPVEFVVLYPAAWNDQAPAVGSNDLERAARGTPAWRRLALVETLVRLTGGEPPPNQALHDRVTEAWERGEPLYGTRVPEEEVGALVRRMVQRSRSGWVVQTFVVVPPHPRETRERYPRTVRDAAAVREAAIESEAIVIDGPALFAASSLTDDELFLDFVHPSAEGQRILAEAIAERLDFDRVAMPGIRLEDVRTVEPAEVSALGDEFVTLTIRSTRPLDELRTFTPSIGSMPLIEPHWARVDEQVVTVTGSVGANGPGELRVRVGDSPAVPGLRARAPHFELGDASAPRLRSRPGDLARVLVASARLDPPQPTSYGTMHVDRSTVFHQVEVTCGEDGTAVVPLPAAMSPVTVHLQALVLPRGETDWNHAVFWSEPLELTR